jgi:hypothetical protein
MFFFIGVYSHIQDASVTAGVCARAFIVACGVMATAGGSGRMRAGRSRGSGRLFPTVSGQTNKTVLELKKSSEQDQQT